MQLLKYFYLCILKTQLGGFCSYRTLIEHRYFDELSTSDTDLTDLHGFFLLEHG
jgi:hypothetical protein